MARKGPVTKYTDAVALGLAQIRVGVAASHVGNIHPALVAADSIGALANTKFSGNTDWFKLESGFPLLEDLTIPIREAAALECAFKEIHPFNLAIALGLDATTRGYLKTTDTDRHSGEVPLGGRNQPEYVRMEAVYTYPNGTNRMVIIFPRAQVAASMEMDMQIEDVAAVPVTFEAKRADSEVSGGSAVWDSKPLGRICWDALGA
jgi:hypothetical protein